MSYKKFDQTDLEAIKNIVKDEERILYAKNINEEYIDYEFSSEKY